MSIAEPAVETNDAYHADTSHTSHSMLEVFRDSAKLYHQRFILAEEARPEPTAAMRIGSALHAMILEPDLFGSLFVSAPKCDRRTNAGKATWAAFEAEHGGKTLLKAEEMAIAVAMAESIDDHPEAMRLLGHVPRITEQPIRWTDPHTGIECKAKPDCYLPGVAVVDVKTCSRAETGAFARAALDLGYHRQAAFYLDGIHAVHGDSIGKFLFVAVCNQPAFECAVHWLDQPEIELGRRQNNELLARLAECRRTDTWVSPWATGVNLLSFPKWGFNQEA